jgi:hypothetical protein
MAAQNASSTTAPASDASAAPGPAQGGGSRKVALSTERPQDTATRAPDPQRADDARSDPVKATPRQEVPRADRREPDQAGQAQRPAGPALDSVDVARGQVLRYLRENAALTLKEEAQFREARARGDEPGAIAVRKAAGERAERDVRAVEKATPSEVRELSQLLAAPASIQTEKRFREVLEEVDRRGRTSAAPSREATAPALEVGRVSGSERGQSRAEDLNERDPLRAWQARMVELRDRRTDGFVQEGNKYLTARGQLAFVDEGKSIRSFDASPRTAQAVVDLVESKRWTELRVEGQIEFQRAVWTEAKARGLEVRTAEFQPTKLDREQAELRSAEYRNRYGVRQAQEPARAPAETSDRKAADPERAEGAAAVPRPGARLVEYGTAPYEFKRGADPSFFVKTERDSGEQRVVWGKDLERALRTADAQVGDRIRFEREGTQRVNVTSNEIRDGVAVAKNIAAERGVWKVEVVDRGAREVAQTPAQATVERVLRDSGSSQGLIDRALRTAADRETALSTQGRVVEVRGIDPSAPRTVPIPTVQVQEQGAPTRGR